MADRKYRKTGKYYQCFNELVFESVPRGGCCLDIGCSTGNLGRALTREKKCVIDGVDRDSYALKLAAKAGYRKTYLIDLNNEKISEKIKSKYDCIILADILEHLISPAKTLREASNLLKKDGLIIISLPNVAFIQNRFNLLFGKFEYRDEGGLMDSNHLRFFTKKEIYKLCKSTGFKKVEIEGYAQVKNRFFFLRILAKIWPSLFAIQYLVKLKK